MTGKQMDKDTAKRVADHVQKIVRESMDGYFTDPIQSPRMDCQDYLRMFFATKGYRLDNNGSLWSHKKKVGLVNMNTIQWDGHSLFYEFQPLIPIKYFNFKFGISKQGGSDDE